MIPKPKILISVYCIKDIGGISTSISNLLNEIHDIFDVSLIVPCNFISKNRVIPDNVRILKGSNVMRDIVIDRKFLANQNFFEKALRNTRRFINRRFFKGKMAYHALSRIKVPGSYDVAIAFADESFTKEGRLERDFDYKLILNNVKAKRKIAWIHNDPNKQFWTKERCLKELTPFDAVVNVSQECKRIFDDIIPEFEYKSKVVYNTYNITAIKAKSQLGEIVYPENGKIHFITVGRVVCGQKAMNRIVKVCKLLRDDGFDSFDWTIVGEGPDKTMLEQKTIEYKLTDIIRFVGLKPNPYPYMKQADAFVLVSRFEGFGMTIKEAQILGTPTLITNFGAAPEVVKDGLHGSICENSTQGVYSMIKDILQKPEQLENYRQYLQENPVNNELALSQLCEVCGFVKATNNSVINGSDS